MTLFSDPVFLVEWVMLSAVLGVGLYTSYTDLRLRRVPNRYTFALLAVGLLGQLLMVLLEVTTLNRVVAVLLTSLAVALGFTLFGFWAPGDAKLFWAAAVALPPSLCPSFDPFSWQGAPAALVLNALLCYLVVLLLVPLWRREWKRGEEEDRPQGRQWLQAACGLAGLLGLALGFAFLVLERPLSYLEGFAVLVIGYRLLERGLEVRYWQVLLLPGLVAILYLAQAAPGWQRYVLLWGVAWMVELVYLQVRAWYSRALVQWLPIPLVQAGSMSHRSLYLRESDHKLTGVEEKGVDDVFFCEAGKPCPEQQVQRLRELASQGGLPQGDKVEIEQAIPFVPFIASAAVMTALFSGNLIPPLRMLVVWLRG